MWKENLDFFPSHVGLVTCPQVFTFGSVPLKTYLPDGDIDLTAFSDEPNLKDDDWVESVLDMLRREEKNEHAEYQVKEIQYIQAEVAFSHSYFFAYRSVTFKKSSYIAGGKDFCAK